VTDLVDGVAAGWRRPDSAAPLRLIAEYDDDTNDASALAEAVRAAARRWGIWWAADRAARLAHAQATWLLTYGHPGGTGLCLFAEYVGDRRMLTLTVGDPGSLLPGPVVGDQWRLSLSGSVFAEAFDHGGRDRRLCCAVVVRAPWRIRLTWNRAALGGIHPVHSYEDCRAEQDVAPSAVRARRQAGVVAVHWQGPDERDDVWLPFSD
jgi:hypothetical protein